MKIERLRIDGFGQFHGFERELGGGLNLFYGPNEAGKSTLLAFIRSILFGLSKRGEPARYEPSQGTIGGELLLKTAIGAFWVRRSASRRSEGELVLRSLEGERLPPARLDEALCAISRELFCQVFAFGLHELSSFEELASEGTVSQALVAAGMLGARRLPFALASLEKASKALFVSRGSKAQLNGLFAQLWNALQRIAEIGDRPRQYFEQRAELDALDQQLRTQSAVRRAVERERDVLRQLQALLCRSAEIAIEREELHGKAQALERERKSLEAICINEQRAARWRSSLASFEARAEQWRTLDGRRKSLEDKQQMLQSQLASLGPLIVFNELVEREPQSAKRELELIRDDLANATQQLGRARERSQSATGARQALAQQLERIRCDVADPPGAPGLEGVPPKEAFPFAWALATSLAFLGLGIIGAYRAGANLGTLALAASLCSAALVFLIQRRANRAASSDAALRRFDQAERRAKLLAELRAADARAAELEQQRVAAELEAAEQQVTQLRERLQSALKAQGLPTELSVDAALLWWAELAGIRQGFLDLRGQRLALDAEEQACRTAATSLLEASADAGLGGQEPLGSATQLRALLDRADHALSDLRRTDNLLAQHQERSSRLSGTAAHLQQSIAKLRRQTELPSDANADDQLPPACAQRLRALDAQLSEVESRQRAIAERKGGIAKDLEAWEKDSELAQLRYQEELLRGRIVDLSQEYLIQRLAAGLLKQARWRHEREQQPRVIRIASQLFSELTAARYACVYTQADAPETLFVADAQGREWRAEQLSRGTREQLYLAFRLALIQDFGETRQPLPIILDDILVNFDPERAQNAVKTLARISKSHQVVAFTCHPSLREMFQKQGAQLLSLSPKPVPLLESA